MSNIHGVGSNASDSLAALRNQLGSTGRTDFGRGKGNPSTTALDPQDGGKVTTSPLRPNGGGKATTTTLTPVDGSSPPQTTVNGVTIQQAPLSPNLMNYLMQLQAEDGSSTATATSGTSSGTGSASGSDGQNSIQQLFDQIDTNGNGEISKSEMEAFFKTNGGTAKEADAAYSQLDPKGSSGIDESQFASGMSGVLQTGQQSLTAVGSTGTTGSPATTQSLESLLQQEAASDGTSSTVTGSDGSTTTTLTYADGTKIEMITPESTSTSSSTSTAANPNTQENTLAALIQLQAQALQAGTTTGQSS